MFRTESGDIFGTTSAMDWEFDLMSGDSHAPVSHRDHTDDDQECNFPHLSADDVRLFDHEQHHCIGDEKVDDCVGCSGDAAALQFSDHITKPFMAVGKRDSLLDAIEHLDRGDDMFDLRFPVRIDDIRPEKFQEELGSPAFYERTHENTGTEDTETIDHDVLPPQHALTDPIKLSDEEESQDWAFVPADGVSKDCIKGMKFLLKSKREQLWRANMLPRMFLTSRYVLRMQIKFHPNENEVRERKEKDHFAGAEEEEEDPVIVRLRLVNADSLNVIHNGIHCPNGYGLLKEDKDQKDKCTKECDISFKCRTNSHFHGNAFFRLEVRIGDFGKAFSPLFRILARRPPGDHVGRVYAEVRMDGDRPEYSRQLFGDRDRIIAFLQDPLSLEVRDREFVCDRFRACLELVGHDIAHLPTAESENQSLLSE